MTEHSSGNPTNIHVLYWLVFAASKLLNRHEDAIGPAVSTSSFLQVNGKAGPYEWFTYEETEALVLDIASAMTKVGVSAHERCSIYGGNCAQWMIAMQVM